MPPQSAKSPQYPDHSKLLEVHDAAGAIRAIASVSDWNVRRGHILAGMQEVMGPFPTDRVPLDVKILETTEQSGYVRYRLDYTSELGDRTPAYLIVPTMLQRRAPAMLCLHQTTPRGKDSPAGLSDRPTLHYAHELAKRGYVCLCPDYPSFGDYASYDFGKDRYVSGSMKAIWNNSRGVDLLSEWPDVDPKRIGAIGHSLGGHNAIFSAVFEPRIQAVVSCCGFTAFGKYYGGNLRGWSSDRYMPKILNYGGWQKLPFDFHEVIAALAPRAFLGVCPERDANFDVTGVREVEAAARPVYRLLGAEEKLVFRYPKAEHDFPDGERAAAYAFLDRCLGKSS